MPFGARLFPGRGFALGGFSPGRCALGFMDDIFRRLGRCAEKVLEESLDGGGLFFQRIRDALDGLRHGHDDPVVLLEKGPVFDSVEKRPGLPAIQFDALDLGICLFGLAHVWEPFPPMTAGSTGRNRSPNGSFTMGLQQSEEKVPQNRTWIQKNSGGAAPLVRWDEKEAPSRSF